MSRMRDGVSMVVNGQTRIHLTDTGLASETMDARLRQLGLQECSGSMRLSRITSAFRSVPQESDGQSHVFASAVASTLQPG